MRKNKLDRDEGRDISEKVALGMLKGTGKLTGESLYDSRLFNQSAGMEGGFGADDEYNAYSKPLFERGDAGTIYRPKKSDSDIYGNADEQMAKLQDTSRFRPDKGFKGAEGASSGPRDAPVQFERARDRESSRDRDRNRDRQGRDDSRQRDRSRGRERGDSRDRRHERNRDSVRRTDDYDSRRNKKSRYDSDSN
jgi:hypothetical protein